MLNLMRLKETLESRNAIAGKAMDHFVQLKGYFRKVRKDRYNWAKETRQSWSKNSRFAV